MRLRVALSLLLALAAACGKSPRAGRNPKETIRNLEAAVRDADIGAIYDMLSARGQAEIDATLGGARALLAAIPESQLDAAGLGKWKRMSAREMLVAGVEKAKDENPKALEPLRSVTIAVTDVRESGDRATVRTSFLVRGRARDETIRLVREGGLWKLDSSGDALQGLPMPVPSAADFEACVGPSP